VTSGPTPESAAAAPGPAPVSGGVQRPKSGFFTNLRSFYHWIVCGTYFFAICPTLIIRSLFVDPRQYDRPQRKFTKRLMRLAGARIETRLAPGYDPSRTCFFIVNHVNLFDPFVLYCAIPQFIRGLELESHFEIPAYGWMMKRFGNVPVPATHRPADLKRMWRLTQEAIDSGISLVVFPEGQRTLTGRVGPFKNGVFRMALQTGTPIVPVSVVGSFEFNNKLGWGLRSGPIVVYLHDTIETASLDKEKDLGALRDRVREIVASPIDEYYSQMQEVESRS
jgi:1-acyl-sn-glycerol-3-phosphate acyltransferase